MIEARALTAGITVVWDGHIRTVRDVFPGRRGWRLVTFTSGHTVEMQAGQRLRDWPQRSYAQIIAEQLPTGRAIANRTRLAETLWLTDDPLSPCVWTAGDPPQLRRDHQLTDGPLVTVLPDDYYLGARGVCAYCHAPIWLRGDGLWDLVAFSQADTLSCDAAGVSSGGMLRPGQHLPYRRPEPAGAGE